MPNTKERQLPPMPAYHLKYGAVDTDMKILICYSFPYLIYHHALAIWLVFAFLILYDTIDNSASWCRHFDITYYAATIIISYWRWAFGSIVRAVDASTNDIDLSLSTATTQIYIHTSWEEIT